MGSKCKKSNEVFKSSALRLLESFSNVRSLMKMKMVDRQWRKMKIAGKLNLFPNQSSVQIFRDMETNEISWKDPENSVRYFVRKEIEFSLNGYGGGYKNEVFTDLFYFAGDLGMFDVPTDFGKQLMLAVSKHVDVQTVDAYERTPLIVAVSLDAEEAVGTLIDRGADMEAVSVHGRTAFEYTAVWGKPASCKMMLQKGAKLNSRDKEGWTPLMQVAMNEDTPGKHHEVVKILLEFGADAKIKSNCGRTVLEICKDGRFNECMRIIAAHEENKK